NASGAVLVDFLPRDRGQIQNLPRVSHFARERKRLIGAHAVQINGHEPGSDLIVRNLRGHVARRKEEISDDVSFCRSLVFWMTSRAVIIYLAVVCAGARRFPARPCTKVQPTSCPRARVLR